MSRPALIVTTRREVTAEDMAALEASFGDAGVEVSDKREVVLPAGTPASRVDELKTKLRELRLVHHI